MCSNEFHLIFCYNFDTNTTGAPTAASEEATATDEPTKEAAVEPQAEAESKDVEPSTPHEEEGDKSKTDSSPTEARKKNMKNLPSPPSPKSGKNTLFKKRRKRTLKRNRLF